MLAEVWHLPEAIECMSCYGALFQGKCRLQLNCTNFLLRCLCSMSLHMALAQCPRRDAQQCDLRFQGG